MNKTVLILKQEFWNVVKTKGFIILTLAFPTIALLAIGIYQLVQDIPQDTADVINIGYLDEIGGYDDYTTQPGEITLIPYQTQQGLTEALLAEEIDEYFIIPADYISTGLVTRYTLKKELEPADNTRWTMKSFLLNNLLEGQTSPEIAERVKNPLWIHNIRLDEAGDIAADQGGFAAFFAPFIFGILLLMAIFSSSGYLLQNLGEEKENRVMEILLSSVSPRQLLTGKVLGLGAVGFTQIVFWLLSVVFLLRLASDTIGGPFSMIQISPTLLVYGITYFILGYLLYAVLMVGIGAIATNARESQQLSMLVIMPAILPFYIMMIFLRDNSDHVINTILTMIPITAPMSVFSRFAFSEIPTWELVVSIILMIAAIIGALMLSARIFRTFALMYGKSPGIKEIINSFRRA